MNPYTTPPTSPRRGDPPNAKLAAQAEKTGRRVTSARVRSVARRLPDDPAVGLLVTKLPLLDGTDYVHYNDAQRLVFLGWAVVRCAWEVLAGDTQLSVAQRQTCTGLIAAYGNGDPDACLSIGERYFFG